MVEQACFRCKGQLHCSAAWGAAGQESGFAFSKGPWVPTGRRFPLNNRAAEFSQWGNPNRIRFAILNSLEVIDSTDSPDWVVITLMSQLETLHTCEQPETTSCHSGQWKLFVIPTSEGMRRSKMQNAESARDLGSLLKPQRSLATPVLWFDDRHLDKSSGW